MNNETRTTTNPNTDNNGAENAGLFLSLGRFFALTENEKPTISQVDLALTSLQKFYGASSEEALLNSGNAVLIETYLKVKAALIARM